MAQTLEELQADRAAIVAARQQFLTGQSVKEVSRSGRKLVMNACSLADFNTAIAMIDTEIRALGGGRRRRALTVSYQ